MLTNSTTIKNLDLIKTFNGSLILVKSDNPGYGNSKANTHDVSISEYDKLRFIVEVGFQKLFFYKNSLKKTRDPRPNVKMSGWELEDNGCTARLYNKKGDTVNVFTKEYCCLRGIDWGDVLAKF